MSCRCVTLFEEVLCSVKQIDCYRLLVLRYCIVFGQGNRFLQACCSRKCHYCKMSAHSHAIHVNVPVVTENRTAYVSCRFVNNRLCVVQLTTSLISLSCFFNYLLPRNVWDLSYQDV